MSEQDRVAPADAEKAGNAPMRERILEAARGELASVGPGSLSMRAVAREVGVTVGALYRYFDGRDDLLTELIIDAYDSIGEAVERGIAAAYEQEGSGGATAWVSGGMAARDWAIAHPHEFALIYGTPVIGYDAPLRTLSTATRLIEAFVTLLARESAFSGQEPAPESEPDLTPALAADIDRVRQWLIAKSLSESPERVASSVIIAVIRSWTELIGSISFELNGHYRDSMESGAAYLEHVLRCQAQILALN
ncbi:MAG: TetR/AcrR family transcriptional regulator [Gulosibacter sp.]|uniref:TetR/AcrR family transcriptional regulator n=1 Tax=Gulosibacter sp. TaxID=2817531 RepID=UPI003F8D9C6A